MSISPMNNVLPSNSAPQKKNNIVKGAGIGSAIGTGILGVYAGAASFQGYFLEKHAKNKTFTEKRKFLQDLKPARKDLCYSKSIRKGITNVKNPKTWLSVIGIPTIIGAFLGFISNK